jgi:LmbE family N-acetylglucosaminyl deacetylase
MKLLGYDKILCLSPHPDDVEYSMLGTIMKYNETMFSILCMSKGGLKHLNSIQDGRIDEVYRVWEVANTENIELHFADCDYFEDKNKDAHWVNYIEDTLTKERPYDCIFVPPADDSMHEHRFVNGLGSALSRHIPMSLMEYRTPSTLNSWNPNLFVSIKEHYDTKLQALKHFSSQQDKRYFTTSALNMFHVNFQCGKKGIEVTEQFRIIEMYIEEKTTK